MLEIAVRPWYNSAGISERMSYELVPKGVLGVRSILGLTLVLFFVTMLPAQADFKFVGKIPAPEPEVGCKCVTGLAAAGGNLFATVRCDTSSYLCLLDPSNGSVVQQKEMDGSPPDCPGSPVQLSAGAYESLSRYWVTDECGDFINVDWTLDVLTVHRSFIPDTIQTPSGLCYQNDSLFAVDCCAGRLAVLDTLGQVLAAYSLPAIDSVSCLALYRDHLFLSGGTDDSLIFEITKEGILIDTHFVNGLAGTYPLSAGFLNGRLYVGSDADSILVFQPRTYNTWVPAGSSVTVEAVPGKMTILFPTVVESCWIWVDIADSATCPPPDSVEFFSDVYDIGTCTVFDYTTQITLQDTVGLPGAPGDVRLFSMRAGPCTTFRDISVDTLEIVPILTTQSRIQSEDDEFSVFALGSDTRNITGVILLKFYYTSDAITSNEGSIPPDVYTEIVNLLSEAEANFYSGSPLVAASLVDDLADTVMNTPDIPHRYRPGEHAENIASLIISSAHTLAFSLRRCAFMAGVPVWVDDVESDIVLRPNPSRTSFVIEFACEAKEPVSVTVYSVEGKVVRRLLKAKEGTGPISVTWRGDNEDGDRVSPGAYFVAVKRGERIAARKIILER